MRSQRPAAVLPTEPIPHAVLGRHQRVVKVVVQHLDHWFVPPVHYQLYAFHW
jgi:hypothetical protein